MPEPRALVGNASSERQVANAKRIERQRQQQLDADLAVLLGTPEGVRVWTHLAARWNGWRSVFAPTALAMAYRSGQQDVAHELLRIAENAAPGTLARIRAEEERLAAELRGVSTTESEDSDA
jgi:hypothetical protein